MLCRKPFMIGALPMGCGKCISCKNRRRRLWASRIMLEGLTNAASYFITLTYDQDHLPVDGSLVPQHTQLFLKKLRRKVASRIRYFLVGEYGDQSNRPHYHAALFYSDYIPILEVGEHVKESWSLGFTLVGDLTPQSSAYIAGYVTKKMKSILDIRLKGRNPEFARMSLKPGIGRHSMDFVASAIKKNIKIMETLNLSGEVPTHLNMGKKSMPLGRYLRRSLHGVLGMQEQNERKVTPWIQKALLEQSEAISLSLSAGSKFYGLPTVATQMKMDEQKVNNLHAKIKIKDGGKTL